MVELITIIMILAQTVLPTKPTTSPSCPTTGRATGKTQGLFWKVSTF